MKRLICLLAVMAGMVSVVFAASGNCEDNAVALTFSASGGYRTINLQPAYDPEDKTKDDTQGVYYFKATLKRSIAYTVWTSGVGTNDNISVSIYPEDPSESSEKEAPSAEFSEIDEPGNEQRYVLYSDDWYIDPEDPSESDPSSWTYYIEIMGDVGDSLTLWFQQGVVIPQGREDNPLSISPSTSGGRITRNLQIGDEYYLRARLVAGRLYWFGTSGGTTNNVLTVDIANESVDDTEGEGTELEETFSVYADPAYEADPNNYGMYVIPTETAYYSILVSGGDPSAEEGASDTGASFGLSYRLFAQKAIAAHVVEDELTEENGFAVDFAPGYLNAETNLMEGVYIYDDIIDESLFRFSAIAGTRYLVETTGAATNLLLRVYDAKGNVVAENVGDGESFNVRAGLTATASGFYFVGVCQNLEDPFNEQPVKHPVHLTLSKVADDAERPDVWDPMDDAREGASDLAPVPTTEMVLPQDVDSEGHGWHRLDRTDWVDTFRIAGRKDVVYSLSTTLEVPDSAVNTLKAEVFYLSGTTERKVEVEGDVNVGSAMPLTFMASANATYYVRISVAEGAGLDYPAYKVHAMAYSATGVALGTLTVNTHGTRAGTYTLGAETVKYPGGSSVLVTGRQTVKFGAVTGFAPIAATNVTVEAGATTVVDVYYSDTFDPKDNLASTATAWALKNTETTFARTLWPTDPEDNFAIVGVDDYYYDLDLRDVTGDAVFSITNAQLGVVVSNTTSVHRLTLPKTTAKYILTVKHGSEEKVGGAYTLAGLFANVGAVKWAKTAVSAKENAANVTLTVNRTAKDGVVRVRYATVDGTAQAGQDYVAQEGVLEWGENDMKAKTIVVKLIPDLVAVYEGNKSFSVVLEPVEPEAPNEYAAVFAGGDTCVVTLTEVSRVGTTIASTYAAKAPKAAVVATEKASLATGTFNGVLAAQDGMLTNGLPALASLTLTASTATPAALSAKVMLAGKTYTFAAKGWDEMMDGAFGKTFELVQKVNNVSYTNTLSIAVSGGTSTNGTDWIQSGGEATLTMNVPDANLKGVQENVVYTGALFRQNAKIQDYLTVVTNFTGYYTVALAPQGVTTADGIPAGNGYLTLTIDNKGTVKIAGILADGTTKPSLSVAACAVKEDSGSANGYSLYVPIYFVKSPCCFGGVLRLYAVPAENLPSGASSLVVVDAKSTLIWNNDNVALSYDGKNGYGIDLAPCGGWYDTVFNLQTYYLDYALSVDTVEIAGFPKEALGAGYSYVAEAQPSGFEVDFVGDALSYAKKTVVKNGALVDFARSTNICNVAVKFARATGITSGTCSLWSVNEAGTAQKEITGLKHFGVLLLSCDAATPISESILGAGFLTQSVKLQGTNPTTGYPTTRTWTFSAPFNIQLSSCVE